MTMSTTPRRRPRSFRVILGAACALAVAATAACGGGGGGGGSAGGGASGNYPSRPVTLTAPADPGSGWDQTARIMTGIFEKEKLVDVTVPVQNRPGAVGCVWLGRMATDLRADQFNIAMTSTPLLSNKLRGQCEYGYTDVKPIARVLTEDFVVLAPANGRFQDLQSLLDAIKADPGSVPLAASGDDTLPMALLVEASGGDPKAINTPQTESGGDTLQALLNGDALAGIVGLSEFQDRVVAGDLKALAVFKSERVQREPWASVPTTVELGYDVTLTNWRGIYGPPEMSDEAVNYWAGVMEKMVNTESWKQIAAQQGWETQFQKGPELVTFLEETNEQLRQALVATGAITQ